MPRLDAASISTRSRASCPRGSRRRRAHASQGSALAREVQAVERLGQDPRERRLAGAARTREQDRVRDLARGHGVAQRRDHRLLADDLRERLGPPAAVEGLVGGPCGQRRSCAARPARPRRSAVHPPSIRTPPRPAGVRGSDQAVPRHPAITAECCFLPDLTRFTSRRCAGPGPQRRERRRLSRTPTSGGNSALLERIAGTGHR